MFHYKLLAAFYTLYRVAPKKVSHYQIIKGSYYFLLKPVDEIRFIRQIIVWIKQYNISTRYSMRDLLSDLNNYAWPAN